MNTFIIKLNYIILNIVFFTALSNSINIYGRPSRSISGDIRDVSSVRLQSNIPQAELQALKDLFYATKGQNWKWRIGNLAGNKWNFSSLSRNPCLEMWQVCYFMFVHQLCIHIYVNVY